MNQESSENTQSSVRGELIKFGLLVIVFIVVLVVVALSRPLIFDRILPAVLGMENGDLAPQVEPAPTVMPEADEPEETPVEAENDPNGEEAETEELEETETDPVEAAEPPPPEPVVHIVQRGENLTLIARRYGVTVEAIMNANNLTNPNRIEAGMRLEIPPAD